MRCASWSLGLSSRRPRARCSLVAERRGDYVRASSLYVLSSPSIATNISARTSHCCCTRACSASFLLDSTQMPLFYLRIRWGESSDFGQKSDDLGHRILKSDFVPSEFVISYCIRRPTIFADQKQNLNLGIGSIRLTPATLGTGFAGGTVRESWQRPLVLVSHNNANTRESAPQQTGRRCKTRSLGRPKPSMVVNL